MNEGHGGTLFRNVIVEDLDPDAILIRGYPKPIVMSTGLNPMVDAMMIVGAHANAGSPGRHLPQLRLRFVHRERQGMLNEAGIAAFIGGEMGVPMILASGDDVLTAETVQMLGRIETVTTKTAFSRSAAAVQVLSPGAQRVEGGCPQRGAARRRRGSYKPLVLEKPYNVRLLPPPQLRRG